MSKETGDFDFNNNDIDSKTEYRHHHRHHETINPSQVKNDNNSQLESLLKSFDIIHKRVDGVKDVRSYIRQMNGFMTDEIFFSLSTFALLLRKKIDQLCRNMSEKLTSYDESLRIKQNSLYQKIDQAKYELNARLLEVDSNDIEQLEELMRWGSERKAEIEAEIEHEFKYSLYPKCTYTIPVKRLEEFVQVISTEVYDDTDWDRGEQLSVEELEKHCGRLVNIDKNQVIDCSITGEINEHGIFWTQIMNKTHQNQILSIIDEISKYIQQQRITDSTWMTLEEVGQVPYIGQLCYCFDKKSSKWLRARVDQHTTFDCNVRYLDTGRVDSKITFGNLIPTKEAWIKDNRIPFPYQALQCALINDNDKALTAETQAYFNELVGRRKFKCFLKDKGDSIHSVANCDLWSVELYDDQDFNINKSILEKNDESSRSIKAVSVSTESRTDNVSNSMNEGKHSSMVTSMKGSIGRTTDAPEVSKSDDLSNTQTETDKSISSHVNNYIISEIIENVVTNATVAAEAADFHRGVRMAGGDAVSLPPKKQPKHADLDRKLSSAQSFDNMFERATSKEERKSVKEICYDYNHLSRARNHPFKDPNQYKRSKSADNAQILIQSLNTLHEKPTKSIPHGLAICSKSVVNIFDDNGPAGESQRSEANESEATKSSLPPIFETSIARELRSLNLVDTSLKIVDDVISEGIEVVEVEAPAEKSKSEESELVSKKEEQEKPQREVQHQTPVFTQPPPAAVAVNVTSPLGDNSRLSNVTSPVGDSSMLNAESDNSRASNFKRQNSPFQSQIPVSNQNNRKNNSQQPRTSPNAAAYNNTCKNDYGSYGYNNNNRRDDDHNGEGGDYRYPSSGNSKRHNCGGNNNNQYGGGGNYYGNQYNKRGGGGGGGGRHHTEAIDVKNRDFIVSIGADDNEDEVFENEEVKESAIRNNEDYIEVDFIERRNDLNRQHRILEDDEAEMNAIYTYNLNVTKSYDENLNIRVEATAAHNNTTTSSRSHDDGFIEEKHQKRNESEKSFNKSKSHPNIQKPGNILEDTIQDMSECFNYDTTYDGGDRHTAAVRAITENKSNTIIKPIKQNMSTLTEQQRKLSQQEIEEKFIGRFGVNEDDANEESDSVVIDDASNESFVSCQSKQPSPRNLEDSSNVANKPRIPTPSKAAKSADNKLEKMKNQMKNFTVSIFIDSIEETSNCSNNDETRSFVVNKSDPVNRAQQDLRPSGFTSFNDDQNESNILERSISSIFARDGKNDRNIADISLNEFEMLESHYLVNDEDDKLGSGNDLAKLKPQYNEVYASTPIATSFNHLDEYLEPASSEVENKTVVSDSVVRPAAAATTANNENNNCLSVIIECSNETFETCSNRTGQSSINNPRHNSESTVINQGGSKHHSEDDDDWNASDKLSVRSDKQLKVHDDENIDKSKFFMTTETANLNFTGQSTTQLKRGDPGYSYAREVFNQLFATKHLAAAASNQQSQHQRINSQLINNAIANLENEKELTSENSSSTKLTIKSAVASIAQSSTTSTSGSEEIRSSKKSPKYDEFIKAHQNILANFNLQKTSSLNNNANLDDMNSNNNNNNNVDSLDIDNVFYDEDFAAKKRIIDNYSRRFSDYTTKQQRQSLTKTFSNSMSTNICNNRILSNDVLETPKNEKSFLNQTLSVQSIDKTAGNSSGTLGISTMTYNTTADSLFNANLMITPMQSDTSAPGTPYLSTRLFAHENASLRSPLPLPPTPPLPVLADIPATLPPPPTLGYLVSLNRQQQDDESKAESPSLPTCPETPKDFGTSYVPPTPKSDHIDATISDVFHLPPTPTPPSGTIGMIKTPNLPPPPPTRSFSPRRSLSEIHNRNKELEAIKNSNYEAREQFFKNAKINNNLFIESDDRELGKFSLYGLDETENDNDDEIAEGYYRTQINIQTNKTQFQVAQEEEHKLREIKECDEDEASSFTLSTFPPPPTEFQTTVNLNNNNNTHLATQQYYHAATTSSSSTATTCRLNSFLKSLNNNLQQLQASTPTSYDKLRTSKHAAMLPSDSISNCYAGRVTTSTYLSSMMNKEASVFDDLKEKTFKFDQLLNINPKRLHTSSKFFCRVHDFIDETGSFSVEVIYSKEDEIKFREIFKLFRICSKISAPPTYITVGKCVSALYKSQWHRAIIIDVDRTSALVKVKFVDLGVTKYLDYETELLDIDEKFFNCPQKALQCTIRLNDSIVFTRDMRKLFRRLVYEKVLIAQVVDINQTTGLFKIILGCQFPKGFINIYWFILSKYNRIEYERVKLMSNLERNNSQSYMPTETTTTQSAISHERMNLNNNNNNNAVDHHHQDKLDTLNEASIESFSGEATSRVENTTDDSSVNSSTINEFTDLMYTTSFLNNDFDILEDSNQYGSEMINGDDVTEHYEDDDYVLSDRYLMDRESFRANNSKRANDAGLDWTPVKETHRSSKLNIEPVGIDSEAERNAAIQAAAATLEKKRSTLPATLTRVSNPNQRPVRVADSNPLSSDTDTSIQVNCCANPFKWASSGVCSKNGGIFLKAKHYPDDSRRQGHLKKKK